MVEAAPQAQPKTTWNAQKDFVQLRVLLGTFLHVFIISARFPFPMSEKVHISCLLRGSFFACFGVLLLVAKGCPKGVVSRHFFSLFGVPFWVPHFGTVF